MLIIKVVLVSINCLQVKKKISSMITFNFVCNNTSQYYTIKL